MKIIVLDGDLLTQGKLSWDTLSSLGEYKVFDRTEEHQIIERCQDADIVIVNKVMIEEKHIKGLPKLKYIGVTATGFNNVNIEAAKKRGVIVTNVPVYGTSSVAQHTFALILEVMNHVGSHNRLVHEGVWSRSKDFCFLEKIPVDLMGLTLGIIGYGSIGKAVEKLAQAFGMKVIVHSRSLKAGEKNGVDLKMLLEMSDVISLHCALNEETRHLISEKNLKLMRKTAVLINTSRGPLIDEGALAKALKEGEIQAAGLDVLEIEPPPKECPLFGLKNCIITPHIAWASKDARERLFSVALSNIKAFLDNQPENVVS